MSTPTLLIVPITFAFLLAERLVPGRALPQSRGWYARALIVNALQFAITLIAGRLWPRLFGDPAMFELSQLDRPMVEGFFGWLVGTFVFHWWHRLRHHDALWRVFHQVHHSPARIEAMTAFYKHPLEIAANSLIAATLLFAVLGCSIEGALWFNLFAATGEYVYHSNLRTPRWLRYFIQTPELHSVHHQYGLHWFNFGDLPLWDRLFGTYRDAVEFTPRCGFPAGAEQRLGAMMAFRSAYERD